MAHEYTGVFMYASEELSRAKRLLLLYTKAALMVLVTGLFYMNTDNYSSIGLWIGFAAVACVGGNLIELPLRCLIRRNADLQVSMNEEENVQRKSMEKRLLILNVIGIVLSSMIAASAFVVANLFASGKDTEDTYQMMYTVSIAFGWDILVLQIICACVQVIVIRYVENQQQQQENESGMLGRLAGAVMNREIAIARIS